MERVGAAKFPEGAAGPMMARMDATDPRESPAMPAWRRLLLIAVGLLALVLGLVGVVVPGLPTTPFVLLAAACFVRASPTLHRWLLNHPWLGPPLRDWETHRSLTRRTRWVALGSMGAMVVFSAWLLAGRPWLLALLLLGGGVGAWVVLRIPLRAAPQDVQPRRLK